MIDDDGLNDKDSTCKYTGGGRDNLNILGAAEIINLELLKILKKILKYTGSGIAYNLNILGAREILLLKLLKNIKKYLYREVGEITT